MRASSFVPLLAALAGSSLAQTANITGIVTNSVTGAPIVRAHVTLRGQKTFGALTNGEGKYSIAGIPPGGYAYWGERVGFTSEMNAGDRATVDLRAGENSQDLKLIPVGAIAGKVLDADGEPVQLVGVTAVGTDRDYDATTDNKGQYRIGGLQPGKYRVKVQPNGSPPEIRTDGSKQVHYGSTYYPGVATSKGATRITVAAGSEATGIDVPLLITSIVRVSGKVLDIPAGLKASLEVGSDPTPNTSEAFPVTVASDGSFVVPGLKPGKYTLRAEAGEIDEHRRSAPLELEVGTTNVEHVELRLVAPFVLSGHVEYEDERARQASKPPIEGLRGTQLKDRTVYLMPDTQAEVGVDDTFRLESVQPDRYHVSVFLGTAYVKSVRLGAIKSDDGMLDVRNGAGDGSMIVLLSAARGTISGTVSDSKGPVGGATVALMRDHWSSETTTDANGHYSMSDVRPGTYRLVAGDERLRNLWRDNDVLEDYKDVLVTVEVHGGDKITQDLKLSAAEKL